MSPWNCDFNRRQVEIESDIIQSPPNRLATLDVETFDLTLLFDNELLIWLKKENLYKLMKSIFSDVGNCRPDDIYSKHFKYNIAKIQNFCALGR